MLEIASARLMALGMPHHDCPDKVAPPVFTVSLLHDNYGLVHVIILCPTLLLASMLSRQDAEMASCE